MDPQANSGTTPAGEDRRYRTDLWRGPFWRGIFSEADGSPSIENLLSILLVLSAIVWVSVIIHKTHDLPEASRTVALTGLCIGHHFGNRIADTISSFGGNKS